MPLIGIPEYPSLPYHASSWLNLDMRPDFDSGPVAMRLRDDVQSLSSSNFSPAFPSLKADSSSSNVAVCSPKARSSSAVAPVSTSGSAYHQLKATVPLLQTSTECVAFGSAVFSQKQHQHQPQPHLQHLSSSSSNSNARVMAKMFNETFSNDQQLLLNGFGNEINGKQYLYYSADGHGHHQIDGSKNSPWNGMTDQANSSGNGYYRWSLQQNGFPLNVRQQYQNTNSASHDYNPWNFQFLNGHSKNLQQLAQTSFASVATDLSTTGFYQDPILSNGSSTSSACSNGSIRAGSSPLSSTSSASSSSFSNGFGTGGSSSTNTIKNGYPSNGMHQNSSMAVPCNDGLLQASQKASPSFTPPITNATDFDHTSAIQPCDRQNRSIGQLWNTSIRNGHDDVFSQMNTFDMQALNRNDEYCGPQESAFSPEQSRNSISGSAARVNQTESPVQHRNTFYEPGSGMRSVPIWLKNLRLHKYEPLFSQLTYDEMMQLTVEELAMQKICEGARKKIILSIQKLRERVALLKQLERELNESGGIKAAAVALKAMIDTPIRAYTGPAGQQNLVDVDQNLIDGLEVDLRLLDDDNLPAHFTRVLYNTCCKVLKITSAGLDDECVAACLFALDRTQNNDAFTAAQKRRLASVKQQMRRLYSSMPRKLTPRSNSWNKDRRQSVAGYCGKTNRANNTNSSALQRQSSLGNNGGVVMTAYARPNADSSSSNGFCQQNKPMMNGQQQSISGSMQMSKVNEQTSTPSYASAVSGSMNGQRGHKTVERDELASLPVQLQMQQNRPVQKTLSAPPLRQNGAAGGSSQNTCNGVMSSRANNGNDKAGACFSIDGSIMPAYCWPPSSVFSAGPIMPTSASSSSATSSSSRFTGTSSAWSCGFEEATASRSANYQQFMAAPATRDGTVVGCFGQQQKNAYGAGVMNSFGCNNQQQLWNDDGLFEPVSAFNLDWNLRLEQLCRNLTDTTLGAVEN